MTPAQKSALEGLVGRPLTEAEVAQIEPLLSDRRDDLIAGLLSVDRVRLVSHFASERGLLARFPGGPVAADALLAKLEAFGATGHPLARLVRRMLKFLGQPEGIDLGDPATQAMVGQLTPSVLSETDRDGLRAMATQPDPIRVSQVSDALNFAEGRMTL